MKAKNYPNLHKVKWSPNWVYRKYSGAKRAEFCASTGLVAIEANAPKAYRIGVQKFDHWLGVHLSHGRQPLLRDIARVVLASKQSKKRATYLVARNQINNHILPAFGHLRPEQITPLRLSQYESEQRDKGDRTSLFNTRKILMEMLKRAQEEGLIRTVPRWKVSDPEAEAPRFIQPEEFRRIRRQMQGPEKLIAFIIWHQGARPREVLQYRWEMIHWGGDGGTRIAIPASITKTGRTRTIPLNSRVERALRMMRQKSGPLFPGRKDPDAPRAVYDREWAKAMEALGLDYSVYNLRDTWITRKLMEGMGAPFVARYIDSSVSMIDRKYAVPVPEMMKRVAG